jgi:hypothetical protein
MGKEEEMRLQVVNKEQNRRLVTQQVQGPFKKWESIQEFQGSDSRTTHVRHTIDYELPTTGKIANKLSGNQADNKMREGLQQAAQTSGRLRISHAYKKKRGCEDNNNMSRINGHKVGHFEQNPKQLSTMFIEVESIDDYTDKAMN